MHRWQQVCIERNLSHLIEYTECNHTFIAHLQEDKILTKAESEKLLDQRANTERAYELYRLLVTRRHGFRVLVNALTRTCQDGATSVLQDISGQRNKQKMYKMLKVEPDMKYLISNDIIVHPGKFGQRNVLIKLFSSGRSQEDDFLQAQNEIKILSNIDWHENVVRCFIGKYLQRDPVLQFAVALDFEMNLCHLMATEEYKSLNELDRRTLSKLITSQLLNGVRFLHEINVLHLNLQTTSVLAVSRKNLRHPTIKIGEFGFAVQNPENDRVEVCMGIIHDKGIGCFETPEVLEKMKGMQSPHEMHHKIVEVGYPTDIFCLGVIIYYVLSNGKNAFRGDNFYERRLSIQEPEKGLIVDDMYLVDMTPESKVLFKAIFSKDPFDRPTIFQL